MKKISNLYTLPDCGICHNERVVTYVSERLGERTKSCDCTNYSKRIKTLKKARIPENLIEYEIEDYENVDRSTTKTVKSYAKKITEDLRTVIDERHKILRSKAYDILFAGEKGYGKSVLAVATLKKMILEHGYTGMFITGEELLLIAIEKNKFNSGDTFNGISIDELLSVDFLLIDGYDVLLQDKVYTMAKIVVDGIIRQRKNDNKCFIITAGRDVTAKEELPSELSRRLITFKLKGSVIKKIKDERKKDFGF